ncbi:MAG: hypothetical protein LBC18_06720 [Opitutaceae bacterium]|nr:hypothetical protein [Opitutaceae bacterium]
MDPDDFPYSDISSRGGRKREKCDFFLPCAAQGFKLEHMSAGLKGSQPAFDVFKPAMSGFQQSDFFLMIIYPVFFETKTSGSPEAYDKSRIPHRSIQGERVTGRGPGIAGKTTQSAAIQKSVPSYFAAIKPVRCQVVHRGLSCKVQRFIIQRMLDHGTAGLRLLGVFPFDMDAMQGGVGIIGKRREIH